MTTDFQKLLTKNVDEVIVKDHLEALLASGKKLRIKLGADPTSPDLHLGTAVALRKLKEFQDLGHKVVFIIGDYTAMIGDPSGRSKLRPVLTEREIKANAKTYFKQVGKILDVKKAEVHYNSEWLKKENFASLIKLFSQFTIQQLLEREDFSNRMKSGTEVYAHEIAYPMMQAYDSIKIKADVEIGGTDQKFNMLAGRALARHMGLPAQNVMTLPLLVGTDGVKKMSKSLNNYIGITEEPNMMFGKVMSVPDGLIDQYYRLCTDKTRAHESPRDAKLALAKEIVAMYHGTKAAAAAEDEFVRVFSKREAPSEMPVVKIDKKQIMILDLLVAAEPNESKSELRRLIEQGAVKLSDEVKRNANEEVYVHGGEVLKVGKRKFFKLQ